MRSRGGCGGTANDVGGVRVDSGRRTRDGESGRGEGRGGGGPARGEECCECRRGRNRRAPGPRARSCAAGAPPHAPPHADARSQPRLFSASSARLSLPLLLPSESGR
eukprot:354979-Chlamydomonas_euryale.AAC.1